jgi:hypothetical protein
MPYLSPGWLNRTAACFLSFAIGTFLATPEINAQTLFGISTDTSEPSTAIDSDIAATRRSVVSGGALMSSPAVEAPNLGIRESPFFPEPTPVVELPYDTTPTGEPVQRVGGQSKSKQRGHQRATAAKHERKKPKDDMPLTETGSRSNEADGRRRN